MDEKINKIVEQMESLFKDRVTALFCIMKPDTGLDIKTKTVFCGNLGDGITLVSSIIDMISKSYDCDYLEVLGRIIAVLRMSEIKDKFVNQSVLDEDGKATIKKQSGADENFGAMKESTEGKLIVLDGRKNDDNK